MIRIESRGDVAVATLNRGKANALDAEFLRTLEAQIAALRHDLPRGLVLTAEGKIFCAGLDLLALAEATPDDVQELLDALYGALRELFTFPRPTIAALNGHAIAGGALLTLACDRRIMVMGENRWGLTEARLGLVVPGYAVEMARYSVERPYLEKVLYGGSVYPGFKAQEMGIIDELVDADQLLDRAREDIEAWTPSPTAFGDIKRRLKAPTLAAMEAARPADAEFVETWFGDEARARIQRAVADLRARSQGR